MIEKLGIGIDIADCNQFKKIPYSSKPGFYKKLFLASEIKYCLKYKNASEHFGGKFAIKEATKKALDKQITMLDIQTSHSGFKPTITLKTKWGKQYRFLISLSHEKNLAIAVVISEKT